METYYHICDICLSNIRAYIIFPLIYAQINCQNTSTYFTKIVTECFLLPLINFCQCLFELRLLNSEIIKKK